MKTLIVLCSSLFIVAYALAQGFKPKEVFVPNQETAVKIAEAVLIPV